MTSASQENLCWMELVKLSILPVIFSYNEQYLLASDVWLRKGAHASQTVVQLANFKEKVQLER
jgi:hypothetical protein